MKNFTRTGIAIMVGIILLTISACSDKLEANDAGPGGLPRQIVDEITPISDDIEWPLYPDAQPRATNTYESRDNINTVVDWYQQELGVDYAITDEQGETRTFTLESYRVILLPIHGDPGGTEIQYYPNQEDE